VQMAIPISLLVLVTLCGTTHAQLDPVMLRTAEDFVLLAGSGITVVPPSTIVGNIGVSPIALAAITGIVLVPDVSGEFATTPLVTGKVYAASLAPPTPAKLTVAKADVFAAYTDVLSRKNPDYLNYNTGAIGGLTLGPGLYNFVSAVTISDHLTLNGTVDDLWIFQVRGAWTLFSGKQIKLIGGARSANVVWAVSGAIVIEAYSLVHGVLLGSTSATVATGCSIDGRLFVETAVTLAMVTIREPQPRLADPFVLDDPESINVIDPGTCRTVPLIAVIVSGLSLGQLVEVSVRSSSSNTKHSSEMNVLVNGHAVSEQDQVRNGDRVQISVCASPLLSFTETFTLEYGGQEGAVTFRSNDPPTFEPIVFHVNSSFSEEHAFELGELAARLETCINPNALIQTRMDCVRTLLSPNFTCSGIGADAVCSLEGINILVSAFSFACDADHGCPSANPHLDDALARAIPAESCTARVVPGFLNVCFPSARCQRLELGHATSSFGEFCPSLSGIYCCGRNSVETTFGGAFLHSGSLVDLTGQVSNATDLSFRVLVDVAPPSLVRVTVETPYITSAGTMCPSAYLFDLQDPVTVLPPVQSGYYRRAETQTRWEREQTYSFVGDLVGRPRSACGNYNFSYTSDADFRHRFTYPDIAANAFPYGPPPVANASTWNGSVPLANVPFESDTMWTVGTPRNGRINYTMGYWDLVAGLYACRDYATGERLVQKRVEEDMAYYMGAPYRVETYSWTMHLCQVGHYGDACRNTSRAQLYAKSCTKIPISFTVAPQQLSAVSVDTLGVSITSKSFLESVNALSSDCTVGFERIAIVFHFSIFDPDLQIVEEAVHDVRPFGLFAHLAQDNFRIMDGTAFQFVNMFLASEPTTEGVYRLENTTIVVDGRIVINQKLVVLTKCLFTGLNVRRTQRTNPEAFADVVADSTGTVSFAFEVILRRTKTNIDVRNVLNARVLASRETFLLHEQVALKSKDAETTHQLYRSYEAAQYDTGIVSNQISEETLLRPGNQICSKHQAHGTHALSMALRVNAVGACVLTTIGAALTDGSGMSLAGREVLYKTPTMSHPTTHTFGCERDWLDLRNDVPSSDGVYLIHSVSRLPDTNHERVFWFVTEAKLNNIKLGDPEVNLTDHFGVGLFAYDDDTNLQIVHKSPNMQIDPVSNLMSDEILLPGCVQTQGNLRASCNLVCFTIMRGLLTASVKGEDRELLVHHISVATVANEAQTENIDRFGFNGKRRLLQSETIASSRTYQRIHMLVVRSNDDSNDISENAQKVTQTRVRDPIGQIAVGVCIGIAVMLLVVACASCAKCAWQTCIRRRYNLGNKSRTRKV